MQFQYAARQSRDGSKEEFIMGQSSDGQPPSADTPQIPEIPDLLDPHRFEAWRRQCLETQNLPRQLLADELESVGSEIAFVRVAIILASLEQ
jgi:hypothetical protein